MKRAAAAPKTRAKLEVSPEAIPPAGAADAVALALVDVAVRDADVVAVRVVEPVADAVSAVSVPVAVAESVAESVADPVADRLAVLVPVNVPLTRVVAGTPSITSHNVL